MGIEAEIRQFEERFTKKIDNDKQVSMSFFQFVGRPDCGRREIGLLVAALIKHKRTGVINKIEELQEELKLQSKKR